MDPTHEGTTHDGTERRRIRFVSRSTGPRVSRVSFSIDRGRREARIVLPWWFWSLHERVRIACVPTWTAGARRGVLLFLRVSNVFTTRPGEKADPSLVNRAMDLFRIVVSLRSREHAGRNASSAASVPLDRFSSDRRISGFRTQLDRGSHPIERCDHELPKRASSQRRSKGPRRTNERLDRTRREPCDTPPSRMVRWNATATSGKDAYSPSEPSFFGSWSLGTHRVRRSTRFHVRSHEVTRPPSKVDRYDARCNRIRSVLSRLEDERKKGTFRFPHRDRIDPSFLSVASLSCVEERPCRPSTSNA